MLLMAFSIASTLNPPKNAWICAIRDEFSPMDRADNPSVKLDRILCGGARIIQSHYVPSRQTNSNILHPELNGDPAARRYGLARTR
jgi:hypothetical protein